MNKCYVMLCGQSASLGSYIKAITHFHLDHHDSSPCLGKKLYLFTMSAFLVFLSHMLCLKCSLMDGFVDFGWISLQLGIFSHVFLDEVSIFMQFLVCC